MNVLGPASAAVPVLRRLGVKQVRTTLYWGNYFDTRLFNNRDQFDPHGLTIAQRFAREVNTFRRAGLDVLVVVHSPPGAMTLQQGIAALPAFLAQRAAEFKGLSWQIMNEMDANDGFNNGWFRAGDASYSQAARGALYAQLLGPVYDAVKRADRTARVITGGIALEPTGFFAGLSRQAPGKYDAVAVHCYGEPLIQPFRDKSIAMRQVLGGVPLWCTEWGLNTPDDTRQSQEIAACLDDNDRNHRYDRNYYFALATNGPTGEHYGLVNPSGALRSVSTVLAGRAAP